jgi:hypothetical protein
MISRKTMLFITLFIACAFAFRAYQSLSHSDLATGLVYAISALCLLLIPILGVQVARMLHNKRRLP